jgi:nucleotide-binding universal stress UspA family protein
MSVKQTILVLTDFSKGAERAAIFALQLAVSNKTDLLLYNSVIRAEAETNIFDPVKRLSPDEDVDSKRKQSRGLLFHLSTQLKATLTAAQQSRIYIGYEEGMGSVTETIMNLVTTNDIWMVVMGNRVNKELTNAFFDSNVPSVINNCGCPVLLVP